MRLQNGASIKHRILVEYKTLASFAKTHNLNYGYLVNTLNGMLHYPEITNKLRDLGYNPIAYKARVVA